ncbi:MAG: glycosyltransferase family 9 protein [Chitinispirillaceae bacterium]|nr:glycosyltransferase family 9 protein [Chitinispirillaceae bacterium]
MVTLVYHAGALGDFVSTLPALRYWKEQHHGNRLALLGKPVFRELARESGFCDEWLDLDDRRHLPLFHDRFTQEAGAILRRFSSAIVFSGDDSPLVKNIRASGIKTVHSQPPFPDKRIPIPDYHLSLFVDPVSLPAEKRRPILSVSQQSIDTSCSFVPLDHPFVIIHHGSGSAKKNWPFERFLEVADTLRNRRLAIVWLKGPTEEGIRFPVTDTAVECQALPVIAALLSRSRFYIGNDSGITHLAAATGCPTVALFGPSDPVVWAPRGGAITVISKNAPCSPCHRIEREPRDCTGECLSAITVDEVRNALAEII